MSVDRAARIADAVLFEGYVLYPYRASAAKNRIRWPFGLLAPRAWAERHDNERWCALTEYLIQPGPAPRLDVRLRWLRVQRRGVEAADAGSAGSFVPVDRLRIETGELVAWDEGIVSVADLHGLLLDDLVAAPRVLDIRLEPERRIQLACDSGGRTQGRVTTTCEPLQATLTVSAERLDPLLKVSVQIENTTPSDAGAGRDTAVLQAMAGVHVILSVAGGSFVSLLDPADNAREAAAACVNDGLWPVLVGPAPARDVLLASPIVLYDYPDVAPESPGDLCDGTEIDELLTLRILTLTDAEKAEARATDPRARLIIDRTDAMPSEVFERLHGAIRSLREAEATVPPGPDIFAPFELPAGESPGDASVAIGGVQIVRGAHVVLRPRRRADAMDMFLDGRLATVAGVYPDVDGRTHIAVTVDADPARELHDWFGRYFYFTSDEIVPAPSGAAAIDSEVTP